MLNDILTSAKATLVERLASPLLGSFVVAWCAWNYRFLVVLLSDASVTRTLEMIDTVLFPTPASIVTKGFLFPLVSALVYVFVYPYPAKFVYGFTRRRQKEINQLRQQIEDETPMTKEESRAFRLEYLERERSWKERLDRLVAENDALKAALQPPSIVSDNPRKPTDSGGNMSKKITSSQFEILTFLGKTGEPMEEALLLRSIKGERLQKDFDLGELKNLKLISYSVPRETYQITHEGRRVLLDEGKS